uniref:GNAT family N-acetyltransferase n=1 Tax=Thermocrispum agreste TaxID=37925 RepID=A0A2W4JQ40_9PSEU|nr:MAG: GNAT family N-acetyltransferase [Thermocrispum agreste]
MTDYQIRIAQESEHRAANAMFRGTMHEPPIGDDRWERVSRAYQPNRLLAAFEGDDVIGIARSVDFGLGFPGGKQVPIAAVAAVGVRADRTRRGIATELIRRQLAEAGERGMTMAALHASEAVIYGRHGYGVATQERTVILDRKRAKVRNRVTDGRVDLYDLADAVTILPEVYARFEGSRVGMITRPSYLWAIWEEVLNEQPQQVARVAVYRGLDGVEGFAAYRVNNPWPEDGDAVLHLLDMVTGSDEAYRALWQFLIGVDLVDKIKAWARPLDEPIEPMLVDSRACTTQHIGDEVWLRLIDVESALRARAYQPGTGVVIEVVDTVLPQNSGRYAVSADGVERTDAPAGLTMDAEVLAMLYLGAWRASALARAGRISVADPAALAAADAVFAAEQVPWCGTFF